MCANGWACVDTGLGSTADEEGLGTGPRHLRLVIEVELVDAISAQRARRLTLPEPTSSFLSVQVVPLWAACPTEHRVLTTAYARRTTFAASFRC